MSNDEFSNNNISLAWEELGRAGEIANYAEVLLDAVECYRSKSKHLETDRNNAINQMSKSWKHASDKESDILTRYVAMAENQFKVKNQRIADLERQLKAEREINDRLRVVETERAARNDELYEALLDISRCGVMAGKRIHRIARETLEKHKDQHGERPLKYIAIQYSRGVYCSLFDSEQEAREEHPYADEIIPIRVSGDYE